VEGDIKTWITTFPLLALPKLGTRFLLALMHILKNSLHYQA